MRSRKMRGGRSYVLGVLTIILSLSYVDRLALGLVLQDVKVDLALTDTQLGLLTGIAFALFYSVMGVPIARLADRGNRVRIIAIAAALWSIATILCGVVANFVQLMTIRVASAVGEAGCIPPAHSLIADYYDRSERPRAMGIYMLGGSFSVVLGYFVAGWLNELFGWRAMFALLGIPGVLFGLLAWFTIAEPRRIALPAEDPTAAPATSPSPDTQLPLRTVAAILWRNRTFRHLLMAYIAISFFGSGIGQWLPTFFIRSFGLSSGELGNWLTLVFGLGGLVGTYAGGDLATRLAAGNEPLQLKVMCAAYCGFGLFSFLTYASSSGPVAFAMLGLATVIGAVAIGPLFAMVQSLVPDTMRAIAIALIYFLANLIGAGLGPLLAGALSDLLAHRFGDASLRYALILLSPGYAWAAWHLWRASATVGRDMAGRPAEAFTSQTATH